MGGIKRLLTIVLTIPLLLTLFGCENALTTYIFQALFAPPVPPAYINQVAKLAPEDDAASFGWSVDIDGDYIVVGAPFADIGKGAAYVFHRLSDDTWDEGFKLVAAHDGSGDRAMGDDFGWSVAISGDHVLVGAPDRDAGPVENAGAFYDYIRTGTNTWTDATRYTRLDAGIIPTTDDGFGSAVALDGSWAAVGAEEDDLSGTTESYGAVYMFKKSGGSWIYANELLHSGETAEREQSNFGAGVAMYGDYVIVGAYAEDIGESSGDQTEGAAYIFRYIVDGWELSDRIVAPADPTSVLFGVRVDISPDYAIAGAPNTSVDGNEFAGTAYLFQRSGADDWDSDNPPVTFLSNNPGINDWFGLGVAVFGEYAMAGSVYQDEFAQDAGIVNLYRITEDNTWELIKVLAAENPAVSDNFGMSIAMSEEFAVIGATDPYDPGTGAVYIFK